MFHSLAWIRDFFPSLRKIATEGHYPYTDKVHYKSGIAYLLLG